MKYLILVIFSLVISLNVSAEECTSFWDHSLDINSDQAKPMSGDTYAAYALYGFKPEANLKLVMKGSFPHGRFMSFESYQSMKKKQVDHLFDYEIDPDAGSSNPFRDGVDLNVADRQYTVEISSQKLNSKNYMALDPTADVHSIFYRFYTPSDGVVPMLDELPRIYAYDIKTGKERKCPVFVDTRYKPKLILQILKLIRPKKFLYFKDNPIDNGENAAIPEYRYVLNRKEFGRVSLVKFKAPTFVDTQSGIGEFSSEGQTRYWSFCTHNPLNNETLDCLPDYLVKVDINGWATIAISSNPSIQEHAEKLHHNYMPDRRTSEMKVLGLVYRNLLPKNSFEMYQGEYEPMGVTCSASEYLTNNCR